MRDDVKELKNVNIKVAGMADLEVIQRLYFLLFKKEQKDFDSTLNINWPFSTDGEKYFREVLSGKIGCAWLAVLNNRVIGYLIGVVKEGVPTSRSIKKRVVLDNMFVLEEFRDKGVGRSLVKEFISWAKREGADNLRVTAFAGNQRAIKFYRRCGFKDYNHTLEINNPRY